MLLGREALSKASGAPELQPGRASYTVTGSRRAVSFDLPLTLLDPGENIIEVIAFNGYGETRQTTSVIWDAPAGVTRSLPNLWLLAVGVNRYNNSGTTNLAGMENLNFCGNDAKELIVAFKAQEGRRYATVNTLLIADDSEIEPTTENIHEGLRFLDQADDRDVVILFMAGHGITDSGGIFYFLANDAVVIQNDEGSFTVLRGIPNDDIIAVLEAPGNRLIFIDACQSGSVDNNRLIRNLMDSNAFVFAASLGNESALELPLYQHGAFTYSLVQQLVERRGAGGIGMLQLSGSVSNQVIRMTRDRQHPKPYYQGYHDFFVAE
jgi:uncharacterized caspase-like protein